MNDIIKKKGKEKKYNNIQKEKPLTQTEAQGFCYKKKKTKITTGGIYDVPGG